MKMVIAFIISACFLYAGCCQSKGWSKTEKIEKVAFQTGGFFLYADDWENPNQCSKDNAVVLLDTDRNYDKAYSLLLTAYASGKKVTGYSDGCVNFDGQTYNTIRGFKYLIVE
ncbi:hypothetical protein AN944_00280 [Shewanella sp. P1-14-1]|uniref:hypothetical protein n=1 Tax=Shewanella sp. P1-14-1 TaxID=1723761 RepID=UPI0006D657DC|nr:hypothetical protein [Shewanella sp. P1-14-1]KPZ73132.1 hypothetical protein AN944_00280 [Shewanella sp. P1-14-1]